MGFLSTLSNGQAGLDVRNILNAALAMLNQRPRFKFAMNSSDTANSLMHVGSAAPFAAGDQVSVRYYSSDADPQSGGVLECFQARGSAYGGTLGTLTNGGSSGLILEGLWHRWRIVPTAGSEIDIRRSGVRCVEGVTGWHSRFATLVDFAKNQAQMITIVGAGVLSCTETVYLDRINIDAPLLRFQAGTHAPNGATVGSSTFFTAAQTNTQVTITPGSPVNVLHTAHGFSDDHEVMFGVANGRVPGGLSILLRYFVKVVDANNYNLATSAGGAAINSATAGFGTIYAFYSPSTAALPSQSNIVTQDVLLWNGKIVRLGIPVRCATNGSNKEHCIQRFAVWGDGNSDWTTPPSTMNVRLENDDSPNADYDIETNYGYVGAGIQGPLEKGKVRISGTLGGILLYVLKGASTDTLKIEAHGSNWLQWYAEHPGVSTSPDLYFQVESRDDPDARTNWIGGNGAPAMHPRTGKVTTISGKGRAWNGLRQIRIDGNPNEAGTTMRFGADTVIFRDFVMVDGDGLALDFAEARYVEGTIFVKEWANYDGVNAQDSPFASIGRVSNMEGLRVVAQGVANVEGLCVGDATWTDSYYSKEAHLGHWSISMGSLLQFNPDSNDGTKGTERSGSSAHPTTLLATHLVKWDNCIIDLTGQRGTLTLGAAVKGGVVQVDWLQKLYTIDDASLPSAIIGYPSLSTSGLTIT